MALFSSHQLFFFFFLVLLPIATLTLELKPIQQCEKNFTQNNMLQSNINNILLDMVAKSSLHGYAISSYATDVYENSVYGVTSCQGDMSVEACSACIISASQKIRQICPDSAKSLIWYKNCFLHYDTQNFIGKPEKDIVIGWRSLIIFANPKAFERALGELMERVMAETAGGSKKFGYGENYVNENLTVYGMAQCTRDLEQYACNECLENGLQFMSDNCKNNTGCRIFSGSCVMRYEIYRFSSFTSAGAAIAPAPSPFI